MLLSGLFFLISLFAIFSYISSATSSLTFSLRFVVSFFSRLILARRSSFFDFRFGEPSEPDEDDGERRDRFFRLSSVTACNDAINESFLSPFALRASILERNSLERSSLESSFSFGASLTVRFSTERSSLDLPSFERPSLE